MTKKFLLSQLLKKMDAGLEFKVINEKPFEMLALATQNIDYDICVFISSLKFADRLPKNVAMVLTIPELENDLTDRPFGLCVVEEPRNTFFNLHNYLSKTGKLKRETFKTEIEESAQIHPLTSIASNNVRIGKNVLVEEFVVIRENTTIGDNSIIRAGTVIGGEGFEFKNTGEKVISVAHDGGVVIGEHVEIQQNTCVDRGIYVWDDTIIGDYSKLDNLIHISHGVKIGKRVMAAAGAIYGGRDIVDDDVWTGLNATARNGIAIGKRASLNMGAVVTRDVPDGGSVTGNFAIDHDEFIARLKRENNK
jgi:UDP-3-O-[3-hydroxymyristoyl] glucosamine N-acyltransferase